MPTQIDKSQLVPILKGTSSSATRGEAFELSPDDSPVLRMFVADIAIAYAFNLPDRLVYMNRRELAQSGLSEAELHSLAVANIPKHISKITFHQLGNGMYGVSCGGVMEASLLLLDDLWEQMGPKLPGIPLATVPARDLLFVTGSKNPGSLQQIAKASKFELPQPNLELSRSILSRAGGRWEQSRF